MAINLVTYAASTVTPQDDALIYENSLSGSGMIYGGEVTIKSANVLRVAAGHGALCGRKFTIEETDIPISLTPSGSLLGRIYIHMDLSDTDEPISFMVETANSLTPVIQNTDVNINNGVYEINLATFDVDTATISNLIDVRPFIKDANTFYSTDDPAILSVDSLDYIPIYDVSEGKTKKVTASNIGTTVAVNYTGTASATGVRYQRIGVNGTYSEINGTKYMEQSKTLSTSGDTAYTFTNGAITVNSSIRIQSSIFGFSPKNCTVSAGSCVVTFPKYTSATNMSCRIYIQ